LYVSLLGECSTLEYSYVQLGSKFSYLERPLSALDCTYHEVVNCVHLVLGQTADGLQEVKLLADLSLCFSWTLDEGALRALLVSKSPHDEIPRLLVSAETCTQGLFEARV